MDFFRRALFVLALLFASAALGQGAAMGQEIGTVTRLQGKAEAVSGGVARALLAGDGVGPGDSLRTGDSARLQVRFTDGTEVTLSDGTEMVVDEFAYAPDQQSGQAAFRLLEGAFIMDTGAVGKLPGHPLTVKTPLASIGIRGTRFWGGPLDAPFNVLLLAGAVTVATPHGSVDLTVAGTGTTLQSDAVPPSLPLAWGDERIARAAATVSFAGR